MRHSTVLPIVLVAGVLSGSAGAELREVVGDPAAGTRLRLRETNYFDLNGDGKKSAEDALAVFTLVGGPYAVDYSITSGVSLATDESELEIRRRSGGTRDRLTIEVATPAGDLRHETQETRERIEELLRESGISLGREDTITLTRALELPEYAVQCNLVFGQHALYDVETWEEFKPPFDEQRERMLEGSGGREGWTILQQDRMRLGMQGKYAVYRDSSKGETEFYRMTDRGEVLVLRGLFADDCTFPEGVPERDVKKGYEKIAEDPGSLWFSSGYSLSDARFFEGGTERKPPYFGDVTSVQYEGWGVLSGSVGDDWLDQECLSGETRTLEKEQWIEVQEREEIFRGTSATKETESGMGGGVTALGVDLNFGLSAGDVASTYAGTRVTSVHGLKQTTSEITSVTVPKEHVAHKSDHVTLPVHAVWSVREWKSLQEQAGTPSYETLSRVLEELATATEDEAQRFYFEDTPHPIMSTPANVPEGRWLYVGSEPSFVTEHKGWLVVRVEEKECRFSRIDGRDAGPRLDDFVKPSGRGVVAGQVFDAVFRNETTNPAEVTVPLGAVFVPSHRGYQSMMIGQDYKVTLAPGESKTGGLAGYCLDPGKDPPPAPATQGEEVRYSAKGRESFWFGRKRFLGKAEALIRAGQVLESEGVYEVQIPECGSALISLEKELPVQWAIWRLADRGAHGERQLRRQVEDWLKGRGCSLAGRELRRVTERVWEAVRSTERKAKDLR